MISVLERLTWSVQDKYGDVVDLFLCWTVEGMYEDPLHSVVHSADLPLLAEVVTSQPHKLQVAEVAGLGDTVGSRQHQPLTYTGEA